MAKIMISLGLWWRAPNSEQRWLIMKVTDTQLQVYEQLILELGWIVKEN